MRKNFIKFSLKLEKAITNLNISKKLKEKFNIYWKHYPILIKCLACLFSVIILIFALYKTNNITDWITAIGTAIIAVFTVILACVAWKTADSWKEEKKLEAQRNVFLQIATFKNKIFGYTLTDLRNITLHGICRDLLDQFNLVEMELMNYYQFDKSNKDNIDEEFIKTLCPYLTKIRDINWKKISDETEYKKLSDYLYEILDQLQKLSKTVDTNNTRIAKN